MRAALRPERAGRRHCSRDDCHAATACRVTGASPRRPRTASCGARPQCRRPPGLHCAHRRGSRRAAAGSRRSSTPTAPPGASTIRRSCRQASRSSTSTTTAISTSSCRRAARSARRSRRGGTSRHRRRRGRLYRNDLAVAADGIAHAALHATSPSGSGLDVAGFALGVADRRRRQRRVASISM